MNEEKRHRLINIAALIDLACLVAIAVSMVWLIGNHPESMTSWNNLISISFAVLFLIGLTGIFVAGALALFAVLSRPSQLNLISVTGMIPMVLAAFFLLAIVWAVLFVRCT